MPYIVWWGICHALIDPLRWSIAGRQVLFDAGLIAIAIGGWKLTDRPLSRMGLRRAIPRSLRVHWYVWTALAMSAAASCAVMLGVWHPLLAAMAPWEIVVVVWLLGSTAEEIFVRGFVQSQMYVGDPATRAQGHRDLTASTVFFAGMHASLAWTSMSSVGVAIVILASCIVGWFAATARRDTGSLLHPILIHISSNIIPALVLSVAMSLR